MVYRLGVDGHGFFHMNGNRFSYGYTYTYDANGNILTASKNGKTISYTYDAWGKTTSVTGRLAFKVGYLNPLRYRGYYYDKENGYYYLQSRYYDPEWGRFINADTTEVLSKENSAIESNIFAYCKNNATNYIDPFGKFAIAIAASAITVETIFWIVAACAVIYTAYVILSNPSVQRAIAKLITAAGTSIKSQISTVSKEIAKALAKAKKKSQKKKYEKHHIVAKSATAAGPSRAILKKQQYKPCKH